MQGEPLRLIKSDPCRETAGAFVRLAEEADAGLVIGAVVIAFYRRGKTASKPYSLLVTGLPSQQPTLAAGAMSACQVLVNELALQEAGLIEL